MQWRKHPARVFYTYFRGGWGKAARMEFTVIDDSRRIIAPADGGDVTLVFTRTQKNSDRRVRFERTITGDPRQIIRMFAGDEAAEAYDERRGSDCKRPEWRASFLLSDGRHRDIYVIWENYLWGLWHSDENYRQYGPYEDDPLPDPDDIAHAS